MDNKKRLDIIKKTAAKSQSAKDLRSPEISEAIHGLDHQETSSHQEAVDAAKHFTAAVEKHLPATALKTEVAEHLKTIQSVTAHEKHLLQNTFSALEGVIQKKIVASGHLSDEAEAYILLAKLASFCREVLYAEK